MGPAISRSGQVEGMSGQSNGKPPSRRSVDAGDDGSGGGELFGESTVTAAEIEDLFAGLGVEEGDYVGGEGGDEAAIGGDVGADVLTLAINLVALAADAVEDFDAFMRVALGRANQLAKHRLALLFVD